jgi:hypothetical protein
MGSFGEKRRAAGASEAGDCGWFAATRHGREYSTDVLIRQVTGAGHEGCWQVSQSHGRRHPESSDIGLNTQRTLPRPSMGPTGQGIQVMVE